MLDQLNATRPASPRSRYSSTLLHLPIPFFCYPPASGSPESSRGCRNWPLWPSGRGDGGESSYTKNAGWLWW